MKKLWFPQENQQDQAKERLFSEENRKDEEKDALSPSLTCDLPLELNEVDNYDDIILPPIKRSESKRSCERILGSIMLI